MDAVDRTQAEEIKKRAAIYAQAVARAADAADAATQAEAAAKAANRALDAAKAELLHAWPVACKVLRVGGTTLVKNEDGLHVYHDADQTIDIGG